MLWPNDLDAFSQIQDGDRGTLALRLSATRYCRMM
jgi:hypothetical protein